MKYLSFLSTVCAKRFVIISCIILSFLVSSCLFTQDATHYVTARWPQELSDLKPDPHVIYGRFANGFRYVLMKNTVPKDRVSMHLDVQAGSLYESDDQKGIAHFLEHMLFRGTTHFPPGELVKYFQDIGMQFGPDANASTGFYETVYDVLLPNGDPESLKEGLLVLQDYAEGALLIPEEINHERNVVLAEKRERDSASYRTFVSTIRFELPGTRIVDRLPIGSETVIRNAGRNTLKHFYDTWYRPEKMVLVIVGDIDPEQAIPLIKEGFSQMTARAPPKTEPEIGHFKHTGIKAFYHFEKEEGETSVSIEVLKDIKKENDSKQLRIKQLKEDIADSIVNHRLNKLLREKDTPFTSAHIDSGNYFREIEYAEISATCDPAKWAKTLAVIENSLRQALLYGFLDEELDRVKNDYLSSMDEAVSKEGTRNSRRLKGQIINSINSNRVFMSPEQRRNLLAPVIRTLTLKDVYDAFKKSWAMNHRLILVTGNADLNPSKENAEKKIVDVYLKNQKTPVAKPEPLKPVVFPYLPDPEPNGKIVRRVKYDDLGIIQIDYENGVRLNLKKTDFKDNEILAVIGFGHGNSDEPKEMAGLSDLSTAVINQSELGGLDKEQLDRALTGKQTGVRFQINEGEFALRGETIPEEISLLFQLYYAYLTDPGYREEAYSLVMDRYRQDYISMSHSIDGAMRLYGYRFLAGGDSRFGLPPYDEFKQLTLNDVKEFTLDAFKSAPLEVSIVGDFDPDTIVELATKYLGSLPKRSGPQKPKRVDRPMFPVSKRLDIKVDTDIPKGKVVIAYPTEDIWDIKRTRRLAILGEVLSERMRVRIRDNLGATYSPYAYNNPSRVYTGYGTFIMSVNINPENAEKIIRVSKQIVADIIHSGVTQDELKRALNPSLTGIKDLLRKNGYWLDTVLNGSERHPEQIQWSRTIMSDYAAITAVELNALSRRYLDNDKAAVIVIRSKNPKVHNK